MRFPQLRITVGRLMLAVAWVALGLFLWTSKYAYDGAREAAKHSSCRNNLKQIVLALNGYESANGSFPSGTIPNPALRPDRRLSWFVTIWPFLDSSSLPQIDPTIAWDAPPNWPVRFAASPGAGAGAFGSSPAYENSTLTCPNDPTGSRTTQPRPLAYVGVAGLGANAPDLPAGHKRAGVFGYDRATRLADITDGTAETMILVETARGQAAWSAGGASSVRGVDPAARPHIGSGRPFGRSFGGYPPGGANAAMADGSVRFIRESIDPKVFEAMATIAGGEAVPPELARPY